MAPIAFPIKLWNVVNSENGLITWAEDGQSILVNENSFDLIVTKRLPNFLRTPSLFSLRRSLRWYNFVCSENNTHGCSRYWHPYFVRDREDLLWRVTIGKKRALVKSWLANRIETGLSNGDDEYSGDLQLSVVAMTSGNSVLPSSFRQKLDFESCDCMLDPGLFRDGAALWCKTQGRHSQILQNANIGYQDTEETDLVKDDFLPSEVLPSAKYLCMAFNSTLSTGANVIDSFATDSSHPVFSLETASDRGGEGDLGASTCCHNDNSVYCADFEGPQCPGPGEYKELMRPPVLTDIVGNELFLGLTCLEEGFALSGVPVALTNDWDIDHWPIGETRSYFSL